MPGALLRFIRIATNISVASERYRNLMADSSAKPGRYTLLNQQELIDLFNKP
jgi:hypothetical protein